MAAPDTIPDLTAWWRADSLSLADAAPVQTLIDSGPNAYTGTQPTAGNRPTFRINQLNGEPVLRFDGTNDSLTSSAPGNQAATTVFVVLKPTTATGVRTYRGGELQLTLNSRVPTAFRNSVGQIGSAATGGAISATAFTIVTFAYKAPTNGTWAWYLNGTSAGSGTTTVNATAGGHNVALGRAAADQEQEYLAGDLAEIITYARVLTTAERATVHSYLQDKYGISVADYVPAGPTVNAGADEPFHLVNAALARTATENDNGSTITARAWTVVSGPAGSGTTIGTAAALSWTPTVAGSYVLRYSATTSVGTGTDDVAVTVLPAYVRGITVATATTSTVTVAMPAGVLAGDHLLAVCCNDFIAASATGWDSAAAGGSSANDTAFNILRRTATGSEPGSYGFAVGASTSATIAIIALAKEHVDTTFDVVPALATLAVANATTAPATPSITTTTANALLITVYGTGEAAAGYAGHTPPPGMLELVDHFPAGTGRALHVAAEIVTTPGATGGRTATVTGAAANYVSQAFAVSAVQSVPVTVSDTAAVAESVTGQRTSQVSDALAVAEQAGVTAQTAVADQTAVTETAALLQRRGVSDTAALVESAAVTAITYRSESDAFVLDERVFVDIPVLRTSADAATVGDTAAVAATASAADAATVVDTHAVARSSTVSDTATLAEMVAVLRITAVTDAAGVADTVSPVAALIVGTDGAALAEQVALLRFAAVTDTASVLDSSAAGPAQGDLLGSLAEIVDIVVIPDLARVGSANTDRDTRYELELVARVPQAVGPPTLLTLDAIVWRTLTWGDTLSRPQTLEARCPIESLTDRVKERLVGAARGPVELRLRRDGQIVAAGPLRAGDPQGEDMTFTAVGLLGYTQGMWVHTDEVIPGVWPAGGRFEQVDQTAIAAALIEQWQSGRPYGHMGIDTSAVAPSGVLRDREYSRGEQQQVSRRLEELGEVIGGFDADVDPTTRQLILSYPQCGVDRSVGADAVVFDRQAITTPGGGFSLSPDEVATVALGSSSSSGADAVLWSEAVDLERLAQYGAVGIAHSHSGISEQATLDARTAAALDARSDVLWVPPQRMRVTPDVALESYGAGDVLRVLVSDVLGVEGAFRVRRRTVQVSDQGVESVDLEFA